MPSPWGDFKLETEQTARWELGPTTLWVCRTASTWEIVYRQDDEYLTTAAGVDLSVSSEEVPQDRQVTSSRYCFERTTEHFRVWPALSPIPVVISSENAMHVMPGQNITLYVSTPLWMRLEVGSPPVQLMDEPTYLPSDTWFGPSTTVGERAYAMKLKAQVNLEDVPLRIHRAITPIHIHNKARESLQIDRVRLPVQYLSLYQGADGTLTTQPVRLVRSQTDVSAELTLVERFDVKKRQLTLLRQPRERYDSNKIVQALDWFVHRFKDI